MQKKKVIHICHTKTFPSKTKYIFLLKDYLSGEWRQKINVHSSKKLEKKIWHQKIYKIYRSLVHFICRSSFHTCEDYRLSTRVSYFLLLLLCLFSKNHWFYSENELNQKKTQSTVLKNISSFSFSSYSTHSFINCEYIRIFIETRTQGFFK